MSDTPQPTRLQPMSFGEAEERLQNMARRIRAAEDDLDRANEDAANAEAIYRKALGERFGELRRDGAAVEAAMTQARGELYTLSRERDIAAGKARKAHEVLEDRRGDRASLHKLVDWSGGIDVMERRNPNGRTAYANGND